jgi:hypothetical protein
MATRTPLPPLMTRHLHAQIDEIWATRPSPALPPIASAASYFKRWQAKLPPPEHRIVIMIDRYLEAQRSAAPFN